MKKLSFLLFLFLIPFAAHATETSVSGVGGGGWLYAGTFVPFSDGMLIGSDMAGVHSASSPGAIWEPRNDGLIVESLGQSAYVQDLTSVYLNGEVRHFAATIGGMYSSTVGGAWVNETPGATYYYYNDELEFDYPIHFSCIDVEGSIVVAGAGVNRWSLATEVKGIQFEGESRDMWLNGVYHSYPSMNESPIVGSIYEHYKPENPFDQKTVWIRNTAGSNYDWQPLQKNTDDNNFGAARDIEIATVNGTTYIVVATHDGIFIHNMTLQTPWTELTENAAVYPGNTQPGVDLETMGKDGLIPWSIAVTSDGALYAAMERVGVQGATGEVTASGVWKLDNIEAGDQGVWHFIGDDTPLPVVASYPSGPNTMREIGEFDLVDPIDPNVVVRPYYFPIFVEVVEVGEDALDYVLLGSRTGGYGLFRAMETSTGTYDWSPLVYSNGGEDRYYSPDTNPPTAGVLDPSWQDFWGVQAIFKPFVKSRTVSSIGEIQVGVQFNAQMHVSTNGCATWNQLYCQGGGGSWASNGYNEIEVRDINFAADGRLIYSCGDVGTFSQSEVGDESFSRIEVPKVSNGNWSSATTRERPTVASHIVENWGIDGDAYFVVTESNFNKPSKLIMYYNSEYTHPTESIPLSEISLPISSFIQSDVVFNISAMEFVGEVCYLTYNAMLYVPDSVSDDSPVDDLGMPVLKTGRADLHDGGILKGEYDSGAWTWSAIKPIVARNTGGTDLIYHSTSDRLFMASRGGIYVCSPNGANPVLESVFRGSGIDNFNNVTCIESSSDGSVIYAGTKGHYDYSTTIGATYSQIGTILKCGNPSANTGDISFSPMINDDGQPEPFLIEQPLHYTPGIPNPSRNLLKIYCIAVDPNNSDRFYFGVDMSFGNVTPLHPASGIYSYNLSGTVTNTAADWKQFTDTGGLEGVGVRAIGVNPNNHNQLVVGTKGLGIYNLNLDLPDGELSVTYEDKTETAKIQYSGQPYSAVLIDFDGQGPKDLFVSLFGTEAQIQRSVRINLGAGVPEYNLAIPADFLNGEVPSNLLGLAVADYDNDGDQDIFGASLGTGNSRLYQSELSTGNPGFTNVTTAMNLNNVTDSVTGVWGDFDRDSRLDLFVGRATSTDGASGSQASDKLLLNRTGHNQGFVDISTSSGIESATSGSSSLTACWADINDDNYPDLFVGNRLASGYSKLLTNRGDGTFHSRDIPSNNVTGATWADMDNNGYLDLVQSKSTGNSSVLLSYENDLLGTDKVIGAGSFSGLQVFDHDMDGLRDVLLYSDSTGGASYLAGNRLDEQTSDFPQLASGAGLGNGKVGGGFASDFNDDGLVELFLGRKLTGADSGPAFMKATGAGANVNWVGVSLFSHPGPDNLSGMNNTMGIGSIVTVCSGTDEWSQVVDGGSGRGGQNDHTLIFGLGDHTSIDSIIVQWPNGYRQVFDEPEHQETNKVHLCEDSWKSILMDTTTAGLYQIDANTVGAKYVFEWEIDISVDPLFDKVVYSWGGVDRDLTPQTPYVEHSVEWIEASNSFLHRLALNADCVAGRYVSFQTYCGIARLQVSNTGSFTTHFCGKKPIEQRGN